VVQRRPYPSPPADFLDCHHLQPSNLTISRVLLLTFYLLISYYKKTQTGRVNPCKTLEGHWSSAFAKPTLSLCSAGFAWQVTTPRTQGQREMGRVRWGLLCIILPTGYDPSVHIVIPEFQTTYKCNTSNVKQIW
jgi:hypothetical protein